MKTFCIILATISFIFLFGCIRPILETYAKKYNNNEETIYHIIAARILIGIPFIIWTICIFAIAKM